MRKIKIAIAGYGNLGRGVEYAVSLNPDMELKGIFTRRDPKTIETALNTSVYSMDTINSFFDEIDVMILCGGSATDLPKQSPELVEHFNIVDSFDTHAKIPEHFANVDEIAKKSGKVGLISVGWDPGLFSMQRLLFESVLVSGSGSTFWGKGVSQGHSDAIRRVEGVLDGKQYTIPNESAMDKVRAGEGADLTTRDKHFRECFVVAAEGADKARIEKEIKEMPNYFADYDTQVHFITAEELKKNHSKIPHGGFVIHSGKTGNNGENKQLMEFSIKLDSNPEFTASVLVAYARATYRLYMEGAKGAKTVFDIPLGYLSPKSAETLMATLL
ncbi:MAG: diaminopimelate dehydrogenase [Eubacteriales bacterium]|jgi:diaminopimelate dehydrogenase|nr:diaminopimelate dehydrogenase [Eubacteriales bacterium]